MDLFSNPHVVVPFLAFIIAQTLKLINKARDEGVNWKVLLSAGNMPSSHTAIVIALLVVLYFVNGPGSSEFGIGAVLAGIVMYDSLNVRRAVGEQGGMIARLIKVLKISKADRNEFKLREVLGHNPLEVLAGAITGLVTGVIFTYNYWPESMRNFLNIMNGGERNIYYTIFGVTLVIGFFINRYYGRRRYKKLPTGRRAKRISRNTLIMPALFGLVSVWLQSESIRFFTTKFWVFLFIGWIIFGAIYTYLNVINKAKIRLEEEIEHFKKSKRQLKKIKQKRVKRKK